MRNLIANIKTAVAYTKANPNCTLDDKLVQHESNLDMVNILLKRIDTLDSMVPEQAKLDRMHADFVAHGLLSE